MFFSDNFVNIPDDLPTRQNQVYPFFKVSKTFLCLNNIKQLKFPYQTFLVIF